MNRGVLGLLCASLIFSICAVLVKIISTQLSGPAISFSRFVLAIIISIMVIRIFKISLKVVDKKTLILRGIFGAIAMILWFSAIEVTSSGRATLLFMLYPVFVCVFGHFFFDERITKKNLLSLGLCFGGAFFVLYDNSGYSLLGDLLALLGSLFAGLVIHYIRKSAQHNHPIIVYLPVCILGLLLMPFVYSEFSSVSTLNWVIVLVLGVLFFIAQVLMTYGYKNVEASVGSILMYSQIPLTLLFSYFIGEIFTMKFFIGIVCILLGLWINTKKKLPVVE